MRALRSPEPYGCDWISKQRISWSWSIWTHKDNISTGCLSQSQWGSTRCLVPCPHSFSCSLHWLLNDCQLCWLLVVEVGFMDWSFSLKSIIETRSICSWWFMSAWFKSYLHKLYGLMLPIKQLRVESPRQSVLPKSSNCSLGNAKWVYSSHMSHNNKHLT